ncbi:MAG: hypothetical protein GWM92_17495 [Gemmatimonadetes bacterium]|nr:hypothetical protein [Gemmatimonadota bacterium]NIR80566.1 hypothetical protein [Gemmatimonadota bacterium]NIT89331.1 hypothetical protein [Gemmatimonadota bacterium]NIU33137.1 hypothetical protein [Gemmatimonadota bacterium]NIU37502.1 hypothetical protein [Gemmatimonadota bacterium]
MDDDLRDEATRRFEEALERTGARDPRDYYRNRLRELKSRDPEAYEDAVRHYGEELIPSIAEGEVDPLEAWQGYGRRIAELTAPGRTVEIDAHGRSHPFDPPTSPDRVVLHLPDDRKQRALLVSLPPDPTRAQKATYDLLVEGRQTLR